MEEEIHGTVLHAAGIGVRMSDNQIADPEVFQVLRDLEADSRVKLFVLHGELKVMGLQYLTYAQHAILRSWRGALRKAVERRGE